MNRAVDDDVVSVFPEEDQELARLLIQAARDEIQQECNKGHNRYRAFLLYIKNNLTNPLLDVNAARNAARLTGISTYAVEFSRIVGMNPARYIEHHRMELARKFLQYTGARVNCVALAVGYEDSNHFSDRFKKFAGYRPSKEPRADARSTGILLEQLTKSRAKRRRSPDHRALGLSAELCPHDNMREENVSVFWEEIHHLDRKGISDYLRTNIHNLDIHHFTFLLERSRLEGRRSRERGEDLALIAMDCLRAVEFRKGREFPDEKALGYAVLANTRRLRLDFVGAKQALEAIDTIRIDKVRLEVAIQVNIVRAYFIWWWKRDVKTSMTAVDSLLPEVRNYASFEFLAMTLDLKGHIYETCGQPNRALSMYEEVIECCRFIDDAYIVFGAYYNLCYLYTCLSDGKKASDILKTVKQLHEDANNTSLTTYVTLLTAKTYRVNGDLRDAEPAFLEAREGFKGLGLDIYVALTSLELAILYLDLSYPDRAIAMAMSSIDCISRYSYHKEAMTALAVLQEASGAAIIKKGMLTRALRHLEMVRKDPTSAFWTQ